MASAELFEDPFDPDEYVERLAWRTPGGGTKGGTQGFNPEVCKLHLIRLLLKVCLVKWNKAIDCCFFSKFFLCQN